MPAVSHQIRRPPQAMLLRSLLNFGDEIGGAHALRALRVRASQDLRNCLWLLKQIQLMHVANNMVNIIIKDDELAQFGLRKFILSFFDRRIAVDTDNLLPWHKTLADLYFGKFLCIFQQLRVALLFFFIYILLK